MCDDYEQNDLNELRFSTQEFFNDLKRFCERRTKKYENRDDLNFTIRACLNCGMRLFCTLTPRDISEQLVFNVIQDLMNERYLLRYDAHKDMDDDKVQ